MNKKNIFSAIPFVFSLFLTSCLLPNGSKVKIESGSNALMDNELKLLYFGTIIYETNSPSIDYLLNHSKKEQIVNTDYEYEYCYGFELDAFVYNPDHLSFLDSMIYSDSTQNKYIFKDGDGDYRVSVSTFCVNEDWITRIRFFDLNNQVTRKNEGNCYFETFLEIQEISFLNVNGSVARVDLDGDVSATINIHATSAREEDHLWSSWEYIPATCLEYGGMFRECLYCQRQQAEINSNEKPLGHDCGGYGIRNKTAGIIQQGDEIFGNHACVRCGEYVNDFLPIQTLELDFVIPDDITKIGEGAFEGSLGLKELVVPEHVTSLGNRAFSGCMNLRTVYFQAFTPPQIGSDIFGGTWDEEYFVIYVPRNALSTYKAINSEFWQDYAVRRIQPYDY